MRKIYYTPGPSELYPTVEKHLKAALEEQIPSISHRSRQSEGIVAEAYDNLRNLLAIPADYSIFFVASATEVWERLAQNCAEKHSFHLVNGSFSSRFAEYAAQLGKSASVHKVPFGQGFNLEAIEIPPESELIATIVNETSSGVWTDPEQISRLKNRYPNPLIAVDVVSAVPYAKVEVSAVDCLYFSVQKGFGLPAGLAVMAVSPRAIEKSGQINANGSITGSYHSFFSLEKYAKINQSPETPNLLGIYLLAKVAGDMLNYGIDKIREKTLKRAAELYDFFERSAWSSPFIGQSDWRSPTVIVADVNSGATSVVDALGKLGVVVGKGYGDFKESQIRIANFPTHLDNCRILEALRSVS